MLLLSEQRQQLARVAADASFAFPSDYKAFNKPEGMADARVDEVSGKGGALRGTFGPGRQDVSFRYDNDAEVLNNISFKVKAGQSVALLGSTGSGKTSLVNLIPRFYEYTGAPAGSAHGFGWLNHVHPASQ